MKTIPSKDIPGHPVPFEVNAQVPNKKGLLYNGRIPGFFDKAILPSPENFYVVYTKKFLEDDNGDALTNDPEERGRQEAEKKCKNADVKK